MVVCRNAEGVRDQTKVGNPCPRVFLFVYLFFGHNIWTRNARKPIKPSNDLHYSWFMIKTLSQKIGSFCWGSGCDDVIQLRKTIFHYDVINKNPELSNI